VCDRERTHWIKVKNPASLAMNRAAEIDRVTGRSTIASETVALAFDTSETAVTALRAV
jgi:hypothetical protein